MTSPVSLTYAEARERVLAAVRPLPPERAPLEDCSGRALREPLVADHALPPFRNTAMDGFAVRSADLAAASEGHPVSLRVVEVLPAGRAPARALAPGEAARIMTGAMLPEGADAIVPFEDAARSGAGDGERCEVRRAAVAGEHVRDAGVDVARGETVLPAGRQLSPQDLALAAALGHPKLAVSPRIRVALFSTGDELLDVDEPLRPGAIRDSNLLMMALLLRASGGVLTLAERLPDDVAHVTARVRDALAASDVVLTIGGVSAGDFDPVREALARPRSTPAWRARPGAWPCARGGRRRSARRAARCSTACPAILPRSRACSRRSSAPRCACSRASRNSTGRACRCAWPSVSSRAPGAQTSCAPRSRGETAASSGPHPPALRSRGISCPSPARTGC